MSESAMTPDQVRRNSLKSGTIGAIVEWYEYTIYGTTAALVFGHLFFPNLPGAVGQIVALATFGVGFLARPVGAFVAGHLGDKIGRKSTLIMTFTIMTVATALIGFLPTYATIGVAAPLLLCALRLAQAIAQQDRVQRHGDELRAQVQAFARAGLIHHQDARCFATGTDTADGVVDLPVHVRVACLTGIAQAGRQVCRADEDPVDPIDCRDRLYLLQCLGGFHLHQQTQFVGGAGHIVGDADYTPHPLDVAIGFSQEDAGRAAFRHLLACGYRRPAILRADDSRASRRAQGFLRAAAEVGTPDPVQIVFPESSPQARRGREALDALRATAPDADAVFCSSDALALGVMAQAHALGLSVPQQFGVLGFGDQALAVDAIPALSTVRVDGVHIGRRGADALIARMRGAPTMLAQDVGFEVVARSSTRSPN